MLLGWRSWLANYDDLEHSTAVQILEGKVRQPLGWQEDSGAPEHSAAVRILSRKV